MSDTLNDTTTLMSTLAVSMKSNNNDDDDDRDSDYLYEEYSGEDDQEYDDECDDDENLFDHFIEEEEPKPQKEEHVPLILNKMLDLLSSSQSTVEMIEKQTCKLMGDATVLSYVHEIELVAWYADKLASYHEKNSVFIEKGFLALLELKRVFPVCLDDAKLTAVAGNSLFRYIKSEIPLKTGIPCENIERSLTKKLHAECVLGNIWNTIESLTKCVDKFLQDPACRHKIPILADILGNLPDNFSTVFRERENQFVCTYIATLGQDVKQSACPSAGTRGTALASICEDTSVTFHESDNGPASQDLKSEDEDSGCIIGLQIFEYICTNLQKRAHIPPTEINKVFTPQHREECAAGRFHDTIQTLFSFVRNCLNNPMYGHTFQRLYKMLEKFDDTFSDYLTQKQSLYIDELTLKVRGKACEYTLAMEKKSST